MVKRTCLTALGLLTVIACVDGSNSLGDGGLPRPDAGPQDVGPRFDAGDTGPRFDAGDVGPRMDAGEVGPRMDAGDLDAGPEDTGILPPPRECTPGTQVSCPCAQGTGLQGCRSDGTLGCCQCPQPTEREQLACMDQGVIGTWQGVVTTPWRPPYRVQLILRDDGTYASTCLDADCVVFYYGTDGDREGREYDLFDVRSDGRGVARFAVVWSSRSQQWGDVDNLRLDADDQTLDFDFWNTWGDGRRGPIQFSLQRVAQ